MIENSLYINWYNGNVVKVSKKQKLSAAKVVVSGRVQGVFYRIWVRNNAKSLNLKGWVCNADNGKVEAFFEGQRKDVSDMVERCREGSKFSDVKNVNFRWLKPQGCSKFKIEY